MTTTDQIRFNMAKYKDHGWEKEKGGNKIC